MWVIKLSKHYHSHNDDENVELSSKLSSFGGFQIQCECFFPNCVQNWTFGLNLAVLFFKAQCVGFRVIYEDLLAEMKYSINYNFIFIYLFLLPSNSFFFFFNPGPAGPCPAWFKGAFRITSFFLFTFSMYCSFTYKVQSVACSMHTIGTYYFVMTMRSYSRQILSMKFWH